MDTVERATAGLKSAPLGTTPLSAVTRQPPEAEPDPYVWLPADNPLIGQTPRPAPRQDVEARVETTVSGQDWRWRDGLIGLTVGILAGGAAASVLFAIFFNPRN